MKFVVAGSVSTSRITIDVLRENGANIVGILGLKEPSAQNVSGYVSLRDVAAQDGVPYLEFSSINSVDVLDRLSEWAPDFIFVVGLSQLVGVQFLRIPKQCCIGFHPTRLPEGRGRAPLAWLVMEAKPGAATLFVMGEGADSGEILEQIPFEVEPSDYAEDVLRRTEAALKVALGRLVPRLMAGDADGKIQEERHASYYGKRAPEDGLIDWSLSAEEICRLIRAASRPHPGAYTFYSGAKLIVWKAEVEQELQAKGVIGRVLATAPGGYRIVQAGSGLVKLIEAEFAQEDGRMPFIGAKLGIDSQNAIHELSQRVIKLEKMMEEILKRNEGAA